MSIVNFSLQKVLLRATSQVNKELVFNHCRKSLQNQALNDLRHQRKQIIRDHGKVTICTGQIEQFPEGVWAENKFCQT